MYCLKVAITLKKRLITLLNQLLQLIEENIKSHDFLSEKNFVHKKEDIFI